MKRFQFRLDRVLRFRRLQMEGVEAHLQNLAHRADAELHTAQERREQSIESGLDLLRQAHLSGSDVRVTGDWLARLDQERRNAIEQSRRLIERHHKVLSDLVEARRKVELLETLRTHKLHAHNLAQAKQLDAEAAEFHLAGRNRTQKTSRSPNALLHSTPADKR